jgi:hypothetical protein
MKKDDIVVMKKDFLGYWKKGDRAKLICMEGSDWLADFTINEKYYLHGLLYIHHSEFELANKRYSAWGIDKSYPYKWMADLAGWLYWKKRELLGR